MRLEALAHSKRNGATQLLRLGRWMGENMHSTEDSFNPSFQEAHLASVTKGGRIGVVVYTQRCQLTFYLPWKASMVRQINMV